MFRSREQDDLVTVDTGNFPASHHSHVMDVRRRDEVETCWDRFQNRVLVEKSFCRYGGHYGRRL